MFFYLTLGYEKYRGEFLHALYQLLFYQCMLYKYFINCFLLIARYYTSGV